MAVDKREFEALRGEPILENRVAPADVPCIETSAPGRLCRNPLVSVYVVTYNHERYIRQAIEGILAQQTDFEYEVVIGEDGSSDATLSICRDFQARFPERIRVLWWHENVYRLGGNGNRVFAHCRGEYVAFCEGDDYWTDPAKLQKQVDLLRAHPSAGVCFGGTDFLSDRTGAVERYDVGRAPEAFMPGRELVERVLFRRGDEGVYLQSFHLSAFFARRDVLTKARALFADIYAWRLRPGDLVLYLSCAALADVCFLREPVSVYRKNDYGMTARNEGRLMRDGDVCRVYFAMTALGLSFSEAVGAFGDRLVLHWVKSALRESPETQRAMGDLVRSSAELNRIFRRWRSRAFLTALCAGRLTKRRYALCRPLFALISHLSGHRRPGIQETGR